VRHSRVGSLSSRIQTTPPALHKKFQNGFSVPVVVAILTPTHVYFGRQHTVLSERSKIKRKTMERRKKEYLAQKAA
jgi:hypothetical protein